MTDFLRSLSAKEYLVLLVAMVAVGCAFVVFVRAYTERHHQTDQRTLHDRNRKAALDRVNREIDASRRAYLQD